MKKERQVSWARCMTALSFLLCWIVSSPLSAQNQERASVNGKIHELDEKEKRIPLGYATLYFPDYGIGATSDENGYFDVANVPMGKTRMQVMYVGKVTIDTLVNVNRNLTLDFTLRDESFNLKEVTVTATQSRAGRSTASNISRQAMDHLQATSLNDLLALVPGGISQNSALNNAQQINIR